MTVLPDSPECAARRPDMKGDRPNSRFQHIHKNKSFKPRGVVQEESVITQDRSCYLDKHQSMAIRCQQ